MPTCNARPKSRENDIDLVIVDADADAIKQFSDIEAFMAQGYDGIFFLLC